MLTISALLCALFSLQISRPAFAASVRAQKASYSKTTVSFDKAAFELSYGQTDTLCATVKGPRKADVQFESDPVNVLIVQKTAVAGCTAVGLSVKSNTTECKAQAKVSARLDGKPLKYSDVTILIPTSETMAKLAPLTDCSIIGVPWSPFDFLDQWLATFKSDGKNPNLTGVVMQETVTVTTNTCGADYAAKEHAGLQVTNSQALPGAAPSGPNQWIDLIGFCGGQINAAELPETNCHVTRQQTIKVGACPVQTNNQTITFSATGNVTTSRTKQ